MHRFAQHRRATGVSTALLMALLIAALGCAEDSNPAAGSGGAGSGGSSGCGGSGGAPDSGLDANGGNGGADGGDDSGNAGSGGDADVMHDAGVDAGAVLATPGWNLVAIDTDTRTYLDYVDVPQSGVWTPESDDMPVLARWEQQTTYSALRFQAFTPGDVLTPNQIMALLPITQRATRSITITDAPYAAAQSPADATDAIQAALDAAAAMASDGDPVDVLVPTGTFNFNHELTVRNDVRLRAFPEDGGGTLHATNAAHGAVHLAGDRSAALFLKLTSDAAQRDTTPWSSGIWVGGGDNVTPVVHDALVIGNDIAQPASAHVFALAEDGGLWAFNYAHDGYADTFHHADGSARCQVVGNRAQTMPNRGDDHYAFVSYQADSDVVHHCTCIANWGRDSAARGLSVVGGGFIHMAHNDIDRVKWAGIHIAQEDSYQTYGVFDVTIVDNLIQHANLDGSHDGLLAYSSQPNDSHASRSFGDVSSQVRRLTIHHNTFRDTSTGIGNGFGIEVRSSVDSGEVTNNTLQGNKAPQLVVNGTNFTVSGNQLQ